MNSSSHFIEIGGGLLLPRAWQTDRLCQALQGFVEVILLTISHRFKFFRIACAFNLYLGGSVLDLFKITSR